MAIFDIVLDLALFILIAAGSPTLGYLFLRIGWPKIRVLEKEYKKGWSVIFGVAFIIIVTLFALLFSLLPFFGLGFREYFFLLLVLSFLLAISSLNFQDQQFRQKLSLKKPKQNWNLIRV